METHSGVHWLVTKMRGRGDRLGGRLQAVGSQVSNTTHSAPNQSGKRRQPMGRHQSGSAFWKLMTHLADRPASPHRCLRQVPLSGLVECGNMLVEESQQPPIIPQITSPWARRFVITEGTLRVRRSKLTPRAEVGPANQPSVRHRGSFASVKATTRAEEVDGVSATVPATPVGEVSPPCPNLR